MEFAKLPDSIQELICTYLTFENLRIAYLLKNRKLACINSVTYELPTLMGDPVEILSQLAERKIFGTIHFDCLRNIKYVKATISMFGTAEDIKKELLDFGHGLFGYHRFSIPECGKEFDPDKSSGIEYAAPTYGFPKSVPITKIYLPNIAFPDYSKVCNLFPLVDTLELEHSIPDEEDYMSRLKYIRKLIYMGSAKLKVPEFIKDLSLYWNAPVEIKHKLDHLKINSGFPGSDSGHQKLRVMDRAR